MVVEIKEFSSPEEIEKALDKEISKTKSDLGECLRRLDAIRGLAEKTKKVRQVVMKLAGKKFAAESLGEISMSGVSVVLDANPMDELTALETPDVRGKTANITRPATFQQAASSNYPEIQLTQVMSMYI